jgi:DNA repair photolyase
VALKKPKGDMYPFVDWIWNPVTGRCRHECSYCYVKRIAGRFNNELAAPHIVDAELRANLGHNNMIFICSGCDLFAADMPDEYIIKVINRARLFSGNRYLFQTKNPKRFTSPLFALSAKQDVLCTTIETDEHLPEIMRAAPSPFVRAKYLTVMRERGFKTMVTIEPIMDFNLELLLFMLKKIGPVQVNIGADSGHNHLPEPPAEKIQKLIEGLKTFTRVVEKKNLGRLWQGRKNAQGNV